MTDASTETTCARCGAALACTPEGGCWCMALPRHLPVPAGPAACLCPRCLDEATESAQSAGRLAIASSRM